MAVAVATPLWAGDGGTAVPPVARGLEVVAREHAFSLARWEVETLSARALHLVRPAWAPGQNPDADRQVVLRYHAITGELERLQAERDQIEASEAGSLRAERLAALSRQAEAVKTERARLTSAVETIVAWQIGQVLAEQDIRHGPLEIAPRPHFPFVSTTITPGVAFRLGQPPNLLVVAPRDRIEVVGSVLLDSDLSYEEVSQLEESADRLGVASLVTPIGGLAAYPAMVPASASVHGSLETITHEWIHHYLVFRRLGLSYFQSYEMRTINETVADMVGEELADLVYARYYAQPDELSALGASSTRPAHGPGQQPTFGELMRQIRVEVERYLAQGDVAGAEAYMAEQQRELARRGYHVRRLNTAYLSFFGAYAGSANPFEERLRAIRRESGSLRAFLERVSEVGSATDLDALLSGSIRSERGGRSISGDRP